MGGSVPATSDASIARAILHRRPEEGRDQTSDRQADFPDDVEAHYGRSPLVSEICARRARSVEQVRTRREVARRRRPGFRLPQAHHIANAREAIRFELDNLGHELPEYQRVRDYLIRAEPLPRTTTRKVKRFELKNQIEGSGEIAGGGRARRIGSFSVPQTAS